MYVAMLLTDWYVHIHVSCTCSRVTALSPRNVVKPDSNPNHDADVYIGRSEVAMWMRVVSSWICMLLYIWSLLAPVLMPDRYVTTTSVRTSAMLIGLTGCRFGDY